MDVAGVGMDRGCNWGRDVPLKSAQMIEPQTGHLQPTLQERRTNQQ